MKDLEKQAGNMQLTKEQHAQIAAKTALMVQVGKLLQEGGFGDSSDEEADEDDANERRRRRKVTPAAKSQSSDAPAAPPTRRCSPATLPSSHARRPIWRAAVPPASRARHRLPTSQLLEL